MLAKNIMPVFRFTPAEITLLLKGLSLVDPSPLLTRLQERFNSESPPLPEGLEPANQHSATHQPSCHRNGVALRAQPQWRAKKYVGQSSNVAADALLAVLAVPNFYSATHNPRPWLRSIRDTLLHASRKAPDSDEFSNIVWCCASLRSKEVGTMFVAMLSLIQLAFKCEKLCSETSPPTSLKELYAQRVAHLSYAPADRTFTEWVAFGKRFARLAAGGTIYLLVLIAGLDLRFEVSKTTHQIAYRVGEMLRRPKRAKAARRNLITTCIIPTISRMREELPLKFEADEYGLVDCTNLETSDKLFGSLQTNAFLLPKRHQSTWSSCKGNIPEHASEITISHEVLQGVLQSRVQGFQTSISSPAASGPSPSPTSTPSLPASPPIPGSYLIEHQFSVTKILTTFDLDSQVNRANPCTTHQGRNPLWTDMQREAAGKAMVAQNPVHLMKLLNDEGFYHNGYKKWPNSYIHIPMTSFEGALDIRNKDGSLMVFVCNAMPARMKETLTSKLTACLGSDSLLVSRNSRDRAPFLCLHFSWYNRYTTDGDGAPTDIHPQELEKANASRTNFSQFLPYPSKDCMEYKQLHDDLSMVFKDVFMWVEDVLRLNLPTEYQALVEIVESLPGEPGSLVSPFTSFVLNINVCTQGHRDIGDKSLCLVLAIGQFKGGELALREPGLVLGLGNGDFAAFQSDKTTHLNLEYEGSRASFVLQTDKVFDRWMANRNGWSTNDFFISA